MVTRSGKVLLIVGEMARLVKGKLWRARVHFRVVILLHKTYTRQSTRKISRLCERDVESDLEEGMSRAPASLRNTFLSRATWQAYLREGRAITLTDDFVPVDNLLAPVFTDSGL